MSGTTASPSMASIARQGEWSISTVLDSYLHHSSVGNAYLGRIMACFDPNNDKFDALPPHFIFTDPMKNDAIAIAMRMMFGKILLYHPKFVSILLRCFACVVHHHEELIIQMWERNYLFIAITSSETSSSAVNLKRD